MKATADAKVQATRPAVDKTATAGGRGTRAKATAVTQARAVRAVDDVKETAGRDERVEARPGARVRAMKDGAEVI